MSRSIVFGTASPSRLSLARRSVLGVVLLLGGLLLLTGEPHPAAASQAPPDVQFVGSDVAPTPRPPRPEINPVSANEDTVVRPDSVSGEGVNDLPTSGIGLSNPADADIRRWTSVAITGLALNAVVLFGVAVWSLRRRRV